MKNLFTYPANPVTYYIDPDYYGDENSGMLKRLTELYIGEYKPWSHLAPDNNTYTTQQISKFINYLNSKKSYSNLTMYDLWRNPVVVATKKLIASLSIQAVSQENTVPLTFYLTEEHDFLSGQKVRLTGFNGSLSVLNNQDFWVDTVDANTLKLSTSASLTPLISFYDLADSEGPLTSDVVDSVVTLNSQLIEPGTLSDGTLVKLSGFDGTLSNYNQANYYIDRQIGSTFKLYNDAGLTDPFTWQELMPGQTVSQINNNVPAGSDVDSAVQVTLNDTPDLETSVQIEFDPTSGYIQSLLSAHNPYYLIPLEGKTYALFKDSLATSQPVTNNLLNIWDLDDLITPVISISSVFPELGNAVLTFPGTGTALPVPGDYISHVFNTSVAGFTTVYGNLRWELISGPGGFIYASNEFHNKFWTSTETLFKRAPTTEQYVWPLWDDTGTVNAAGNGWFTLSDYSARMSASQVVGNGWVDSRNTNAWGDDYALLEENSIVEDTGYTLNGSPLLRFKSDTGTDRPIYTLDPNSQIVNLLRYDQKSDPSAAEGVWSQSKLRYIQITENAADTDVFDALWAWRDQSSSNLLYGGQQPLLYKTISGWRVIIPVSYNGSLQRNVLCAQFYWDEETEQMGLPVTSGEWVGKSYWQKAIHTDREVVDPVLMDITQYGSLFTIWNTDYNTPPNDLRSGDRIVRNGSPYAVFKVEPRAAIAGRPYGGWNWCAFAIDPADNQIQFNNGIPNTLATGTISTYYKSAFYVVTPDRGLVTETRYFVRTKQITGLLERTVNPELGTATVGRTFLDSTTGKITEVRISPPGETQVLDYTIPNTGYIALSPSEPYPYEIDTVRIIMPGNISYSYQDVSNNKVYAAQVQPTQYWKAGATTSTYYSNSGETAADFEVTVDGLGKLNSVTLVSGDGPEGRYATGEDILLPIVALANQYVAPVPTPAELADVWDTEDQWLNTGFDSTKEWPALWKPESASITVAQPSSTTVSQAGTKYVRQAGFTKWTLEVSYPPMPVEDFQQYHAVVQAARGQTVPFYFRLQYPDGNILWANMDQAGTPTTVLFREDVSAGETTALLEGFAGNQVNAFKAGEVIIHGSGAINGNLMTVLNTVNANAFGEAKIRTAYPFNTSTAGNPVYKNPYHVIVTLADDDFVYTVGTDGLYRMSVKFTLDEWK
jgi:hypothetical protein